MSMSSTVSGGSRAMTASMSSGRGFAFQSFGSGRMQTARVVAGMRALRGQVSMMVSVSSFGNGLGSRIGAPHPFPHPTPLWILGGEYVVVHGLARQSARSTRRRIAAQLY